MDLNEQYQRFIAWQCRLRKQCVRELDGRPSEGMGAGVYSISGGDEKSRMNFMIMRKDSTIRTEEIRHIVRKTQDPSVRVKDGLRILSELHYHEVDQFENRLTALFALDSALAEALLEAGQCHLKFGQGSIEHAFDFSVESLDPDDELFQATYWHNHLFNPSLPGQVHIFAFTPGLSGPV